jgi:exopolysaccharide production protein ExoZ
MMIKNIQALRALAVMVVVLGHLQPLAQQVHPLLTWVGLGRAGVDLFFVISGFIMVYTTEREAPSAAQFALRRLIRIVPL